ncbi:CoA-binding protein [Candidatus Woesearchaeota archaeon]|nr:MAG: CoA-binding protein [Candidatus Woesearchaeota archaeon]
MQSIAIIGASNNKDKYGNKAVRAYKQAGFKVFPVNLKEKTIEGLPCFTSILDIKEPVETASLYVSPEIGLNLVEAFAKKGIKQVYLNPGSESPAIIKKLKDKKIKVLQACSILAIGINPGAL